MDNELYEREKIRKWQHMTQEEKQREMEMLLESKSRLLPIILLQQKLKQII